MTNDELIALATTDPSQRVRIIRTLVIEGKAGAVITGLERAWLGPDHPVQHVLDAVYTETARRITKVSLPRAQRPRKHTIAKRRSF